MTKSKIRKPYDQHARNAISFPNATMAKQSFKAETDINTIMAKYQATGLIDHVQRVQGAYGDFTSVQDYQLSLNQVIEAQEAFERLPSKIRARFSNDPAHLMAFMEDPANLEESITLGLREKPQGEQPAPTTPQPKKEAQPPSTPSSDEDGSLSKPKA